MGVPKTKQANSSELKRVGFWDTLSKIISHLSDPRLLLDYQLPPGVDVAKSVGGVTEVISVINVFDILK